MKRGIDNSEHCRWGDGCDGWVLSPSPDMMIIQERMPPRTAEKRHFHLTARQFFYVLAGELTMELEGEHHLLPPMTGIEIVRARGIKPGMTATATSISLSRPAPARAEIVPNIG